MCECCKAKGIIRPATCVDHIEPWPICADRFYDLSNLQALCDDCNHEKGQRDKKKIERWRLSQQAGGGRNLSTHIGQDHIPQAGDDKS